jgi:hypothetical protein
MPFQLPSKFNKELAPTTIKVYKGKLNKLSKEGFDTVDSLKNDPKAVIEAIKKLTGDDTDDKSQNVRRYYLSAIFWVADFPKKNPYYTYYQKCLPAFNGATGEKWVKRKDLQNENHTNTS